MKKVVLSLAAVALLTVVSCKDANAEAPVEETVTEEVIEPVQEATQEAVETVEDAANEAGEAIEGAAQDVKEEVKEATK